MNQISDQPVNKEALALKTASLVKERSQAPIIKAHRLAYLILRRPDVEKAARFFINFGLLVEHRERDAIYFRGRSRNGIILVLKKGSRRLEGFGLEATPDDLKTLRAKFDTDIVEHSGPVGGKYVHVNDPDGLTIQVCSELRALEAIPGSHEQSVGNHSNELKRIGETVRHQVEPRTVYKLGHSVIGVAKIKDSLEWYQNTLGMIVSDFQFLENDPLPVAAFMRFDVGDVPSDHHSVAVVSVIEKGHVHSAFEMESFEEIAIAGEWARQQHYVHGWGIGRHVLGSQIFDYWREPKGDLFEHYADGDVFTASAKAGYHFFHGDVQHQWAPEISKEFTGENRRGDMLKAIFKRLPSSDDLSMARVRRILKAVKNK